MLDAYTHVLPRKYFDRVDALLGDTRVSSRIKGYHAWFSEFRALVDLDQRWRLIEGLDDYTQILVPAAPPIEELGPPDRCLDLARLVNDETAELVASYPDRFTGFVAGLPLNDVDASVEEFHRAASELGALGFQLYTNVSGRPVDDPRFEPLFAEAAKLGRAIWLHPTRGAASADYETEEESRFGLWWSLGWPHETSLAMARLVYSGVFERYPDLRVITHHGGGMVPQFSWRLAPLAFDDEPNTLTKPILDYFKLFYADTVLGTASAVRCSLDFFGVERIMFGSDMPFGKPTVVKDMIEHVKELGLSQEDEARIFSGNALRALKVGSNATHG